MSLAEVKRSGHQKAVGTWQHFAGNFVVGRLTGSYTFFDGWKPGIRAVPCTKFSRFVLKWVLRTVYRSADRAYDVFVFQNRVLDK